MSEQRYAIDLSILHIELEQKHRELPNGNLACFSRKITVKRDGTREYSEWQQTGAEIIGPWQRTAKDCGIQVDRQPLLNRLLAYFRI